VIGLVSAKLGSAPPEHNFGFFRPCTGPACGTLENPRFSTNSSDDVQDSPRQECYPENRAEIIEKKEAPSRRSEETENRLLQT
jgi:hypothetical protein